MALFVLHAWLPCGTGGFPHIIPGIVFTMVASLISGIVFGQYLARFANNYVTMYAGSPRSSSRWCFCISSPRFSSTAAS